MPIINDPLFWCLAIPAFLLNGISKGGFASGAGNVSVPMMALVIPAPQAAGIALPVLCAIDISGLRAWWGLWNRKELATLILGGLVGIALGAAVFGLLGDRQVKLMVGGIALAFLARSLWQARPGRAVPEPATPSRVKGSFWALISGLTSTIAHAGGPPLAVYTYPLRMDRRTLSATTAAFFAVTNYTKLIPYFALGQLSTTNLLTSLLLLPLAPIGVRIGIWLSGRISDRTFYRLIYVMLAITGCKLVYDGLS